eukprot:TRINITY_DN22356_c0_g5_i1.p1 TRINITY_DN22356_c0_g5~~TRINITY_DN22356_c0_g5_i1.p1  ORF type:complete len:226 (-),score=39.66 TRINITY_DN22356_c0_g5_i1:228-905(-)
MSRTQDSVSEKILRLQESVDSIFGRDDDGNLANLDFSLSIADPSLEDCPLIGCSVGFLKLSGYELEEIVGKNCRFLTDHVPDELIDQFARARVRDFCAQVAMGQTYQNPFEEGQAWWKEGRHSDEGLFTVLVNQRKDGTLFRNMFYLRAMNLDSRTCIVALQAEMPDEEEESASDFAIEQACRQLDSNMDKVQKILAPMFWTQASMRRQEDHEEDGFDPEGSDSD